MSSDNTVPANDQPTDTITVGAAPEQAVPLASTRRTLPRWAVPAACAVSGLLVGSGVTYLATGSSDDKPKPAAVFTLTGSMKISGDYKSIYKSDGACTGTGGYKDIRGGAQVNVYDNTGRILATGSLGMGAATEDKASTTTVCTFPVVVDGVPAGAGLYQVEVSHRGKLTVSESEATAGQFAASLS